MEELDKQLSALATALEGLREAQKQLQAASELVVIRGQSLVANIEVNYGIPNTSEREA